MSRHFSDWIEAYLSLVKGRTEAPTIYSYWTAIATVAAAVTRHVYIDEIRYQFYPNFLIILAGRAGVVKKSTTIDECMDLLREIDPSTFGADETTWPALCDTLAKRTHSEANGNSPDPLEDTYTTQCALTLCLGEFGTFLRPNDRDMINGITRIWDGKAYLKNTKTSGVDNIPNPFLHIIGAATEKWLLDNFRAFTGWGIASRIIFVHTDEDPIPIARPSKLIVLNEWLKKRELLKDDLRHIMTLKGPCSFTPEADDLAENWYVETSTRLSAYSRDRDADPWLCDFLARKQVHVHKLAIVLSVSRRDTLFITATDFLDAVAAVDAVESEIRRVFSMKLAPSEAAFTERALYETIHAELSNGLCGVAPKRYVLNRLANYVDGASADRILTSFLHRGLLREVIGKNGNEIHLTREPTSYMGEH